MIITALEIIHRPLFNLKHVSEIEVCPLPQVEPTQLVPIDRASLCLRTEQVVSETLCF
jgi:hypothetical protein